MMRPDMKHEPDRPISTAKTVFFLQVVEALARTVDPSIKVGLRDYRDMGKVGFRVEMAVSDNVDETVLDLERHAAALAAAVTAVGIYSAGLRPEILRDESGMNYRVSSGSLRRLELGMDHLGSYIGDMRLDDATKDTLIQSYERAKGGIELS